MHWPNLLVLQSRTLPFMMRTRFVGTTHFFEFKGDSIKIPQGQRLCGLTVEPGRFFSGSGPWTPAELGSRLRADSSNSVKAAFVFALAMFSPAPWMATAPSGLPVATAPAAARHHQDDRSRSPSGAGCSQVSDMTSAASEQSVTGFPLGDQWFNDNVFEQQVRQEFFEIPQWKRKGIIIKCMEKMPDNIHSWLAVCIRNNRTNDIQRRLEKEANVHVPRSGPPRVNTSGAAVSPEVRRSCAPSQPSVAAQPVESTRRVGPSGVDRREPAAWAAEVIDAWPEKKSRLVQCFLSAISPATQARVQGLAPATQAVVAMSVALNVCEGDSADAVTQECIRRLQSGTASRPTPGTGIMSPRPASATIQLQLIFVAPEPLVSLVLAKSFMSVMESMCPGAFSLLPLVIISLRDAPCMALAPEAERLKVSIDGATTSLSTMETFIENNKANFKQYGIKTVFISMIEAVTGAGGAPPQRSASALHGGAFRFLWSVARWSHSLRAITGDNAVCELAFAPTKLEDDLKSELGKVVGPMTTTANVSYNRVGPAPSVFCTPGGSAIVPVCRAIDYETQEIDGWRVTSECHVPEDMTGGIISFIARASEIRVFQERPLTMVEQTTIYNFTMNHTQTGEHRLVAREWWLRWFGYNKTPVMNMLNSLFPCHVRIFSVTGAPVVGDAAGGDPCGRLRWCTNCEKAFAVLDGTFSLPVMVDATVAMMIKARQLWSSGQDEAPWVRHVDINRTHMCGASCPYAA